MVLGAVLALCSLLFCFAIGVGDHGSTSITGASALGAAGSGGAARFSRFDLTISEYGGYIDELKWTPGLGFELPKQFRWHYNRNLIVKANGAATLIARTIETYFPGRLGADQPPFEVLFVISDYPMTKCVAKREQIIRKNCHVDQWEPIFFFGTTLRDKTRLPSMIGGPLMAFHEVSRNILEHMDGEVFESNWRRKWNMKDYRHEFFDSDALQAQGFAKSRFKWENLKPKCVWRGTDYPFLGEMYDGYKKESCKSESDCYLNELASASNVEVKMREMIDGDDISPRLRAVLISLLKPDLVDARFFTGGSFNGEGIDDETLRTRLGEKLKIDTHDRMESPEMSHYKYQLDLGGWGGTTWTGTIHKLSMPGVLLHHETKMVDSYFEEIKPWVHYIPVNEDLSDLEEKLKWAMHHDDKCKAISENASKWVEEFTKRSGLLRHNYEKLALPLQNIIDRDHKFLIDFDMVHNFSNPLIVTPGPLKLLDENDV